MPKKEVKVLDKKEITKLKSITAQNEKLLKTAEKNLVIAKKAWTKIEAMHKAKTKTKK